MQVMLLPKIPLPKKLSKKIARFSTQKIDPATGLRNESGKVVRKLILLPASREREKEREREREGDRKRKLRVPLARLSNKTSTE